MNENKLKKQELILSTIILIFVPILLYILLYFIIKPSTPPAIVVHSTMMFSFGVTTLFNLSCIIAGLFKGTFIVVVRRIRDFFENLTISFKFAIKSYIVDLKEGGITFWIYFLIIVLDVILFAIGLVNCLDYYIKF